MRADGSTHVWSVQTDSSLTSNTYNRSRDLIGIYMTFVSTKTFTAEQKASAVALERAFEKLLRSANVHETMVLALRVEQIFDQALITALDSTEAGLKASATYRHDCVRRLRTQEGDVEAYQSLDPSKDLVGRQAAH